MSQLPNFFVPLPDENENGWGPTVPELDSAVQRFVGIPFTFQHMNERFPGVINWQDSGHRKESAFTGAPTDFKTTGIKKQGQKQMNYRKKAY